MRIFLCAAVLAALIPAAHAQSQSPSDLGFAIDGAVHGLVQRIQQQDATIQTQAARIKELEDKYEPKKNDARAPAKN